MRLKYLFGVKYADGSEFFQTPNDVSTVDPKRSAFYDVVPRLGEIDLFQLEGDGHTYLVDLQDGHFEIDGVLFDAGDPRVQLPPDIPRRLIYFRRHRHDLTEGVETSHEVEYHLGWQATWEDRNYQQTLSVK